MHACFLRMSRHFVRFREAREPSILPGPRSKTAFSTRFDEPADDNCGKRTLLGPRLFALISTRSHRLWPLTAYRYRNGTPKIILDNSEISRYKVRLNDHILVY